MKAFFAVPALFAAAALADPWSYTWTFSSGSNTWTSVTVAPTGALNTTTSATPYTGPSEWTFTTSYDAPFSSGSSTWTVPTAVTYSAGETWTSMVNAPDTPSGSSASGSNATHAATSAATITSAPASSHSASAATTAATSTFTGAAAQVKIAGVGAMAVAGLALVL